MSYRLPHRLEIDWDALARRRAWDVAPLPPSAAVQRPRGLRYWRDLATDVSIALTLGVGLTAGVLVASRALAHWIAG